MTTDEIAKLFTAKVPEFEAAFGPCVTNTVKHEDAVATSVLCKQIKNGKILAVAMAAKPGYPAERVHSVMDNAFNVMRRELEAA